MIQRFLPALALLSGLMIVGCTGPGSTGAVAKSAPLSLSLIAAPAATTPTFKIKVWAVDIGDTMRSTFARTGPDTLNIPEGPARRVIVERYQDSVLTDIGDTLVDIVAGKATQVTIRLSVIQLTLTASAGKGGSVIPAGNIPVGAGRSTSVSVYPDAGYVIDSVIVDGSKADVSDKPVVTMKGAARTLRVVFGKIACPITATVTGSGVITGPTAILWGSSKAYAITPAAGFIVSDVAIDGKSIGAVSSYLFLKVEKPHTIAATFVARPAGKVLLNLLADYGVISAAPSLGFYDTAAVVTLTANPEPGYRFSAWEGAGISSTANPYQLTLDSSRTVKAVFVKTPAYRLIPSTTVGGVISPKDTVVADSGSLARFTFRPATGYRFDSVTVNGVKADIVHDSLVCLDLKGISADAAIVPHFSKTLSVLRFSRDTVRVGRDTVNIMIDSLSEAVTIARFSISGAKIESAEEIALKPNMQLFVKSDEVSCVVLPGPDQTVITGTRAVVRLIITDCVAGVPVTLSGWMEDASGKPVSAGTCRGAVVKP